MKQHKKEKPLHFTIRYIFIILGAAMAAAAIELFLVPNSIIDGGIIGISLIVDYLTVVPFGILLVIINLPFLYFGYKHIGRNFFISSIFAIVALALIEIPLHRIEPFVEDPLLATIFGGLLLGAGVGLVIRNGGALDGTEILGILLTKKLPFSIGEFVMFFNVFIFGWAAFVLGIEQAMYSVLTYYIASKTIDVVIQGLDDTKAVLIISEEYEEIGLAINDRLGRSFTKLHGKGGYLNSPKDIIYVVVTRLEITKLKQIVADIDSKAFLTIMDTQEVHGGTFKAAIH
ncbi:MULTISPECIES: YitT family protein [Planococcus]|uniref:YitT family protein n=1 Tax=Planococcus wigleyi TaxID=2762216 RepID=A0ABR8WIB0_9BACL|nr:MULTISPECIES: YitT family protein [Planococcus]MBD8016795.1 YitT family protein [Planococcus wigleyi]MBF6633478.1 YitT family protein [Planococcus sp. (in: firmicutes)]MDN3439978.1 YitT family protein [Planococcus sp. APC 3900]